MKEALLYEKLEDSRVHCYLCAHHCRIADGKRGICQVRENHGGVLYSLVYGELIAQAVDPIEKKPLFHFHPGSTALSIATVGCNFRCTFCQNADISQMPRDETRIAGH
jgi:pyruvate formate lyase activating enzyme